MSLLTANFILTFKGNSFASECTAEAGSNETILSDSAMDGI